MITKSNYFFIAVLMFVFIWTSSVCAEELNYSADDSMNYGNNFSGEIWQPGEFDAGSSGSVKAKVSCTDISVDFNAGAMVDEYKDMLYAIIANPEIWVINGTVEGVAMMRARAVCGGQGGNLSDFPEQVMKFVSCMQKGIGDSFKTKTGGAAGTTSFVSFESEMNPGVGSSISGCMGDVVADGMGEAFRSCLREKTRFYVRSIQNFMEWGMNWKAKMRFQTQQKCILDERQKETDLVKAVNTYGPVMAPDGTMLNCDGGECKNEKVAWSGFALTKEDDAGIKADVFTYVEKAFKASTLDDSVKKAVYSFLQNWFEGQFVNANMWDTERECNGIAIESDVDAVLSGTSVGFDFQERVDIYSDNPNWTRKLFLKNPSSKVETVEVMKQSCSLYVNLAEKRVFTSYAEKPASIFNSKVLRENWQLGLDKLNVDLQLKDEFDQVQKTSATTRKFQRERMIDDAVRSIRSAKNKEKRKRR